MKRFVTVLVLFGVFGLPALAPGQVKTVEQARLEASLRAPRFYPNITWAQLQKIHADQLAKMWVVRNGKEWLQVREWDEYGTGLRPTEVWATIPREYEIEIHDTDTQGRLFVRIVRKGRADASGRMAVLDFPSGEAGTRAYSVGDSATLWLSQNPGEQDTRGARWGNGIYYPRYTIRTAREAAAYHVPTAREVAIAMRDDGRTFVAKLPTARKICHACGGTGKTPAEAAQAAGAEEEKAARQSREANGRENFLYGPSLTEQLEAKRERQQRTLPQPCPKCGGSGGFAVEEFRRLIFKKQ